MVFGAVLAVTLGAVSLLLSSYLNGSHEFAPGACQRVEPFLLSEIVGQDLAVQQASDAICDHLAQSNPLKPLVMSAHGPPGVGKTLMHLLLARALYSKDPKQTGDCPGGSCPSYKVLYGMDFTISERDQQHHLLKAAIMEHVKYSPETLLVIEEYDKLDCQTRGLLRQLVDSPHSTNASLSRSIIILESNTGFLELHKLLKERGSREKVSAEEAQKLLKDLVFSLWTSSGCESTVDVLKLLSLIDFYLPFFPLERRHISSLFEIKLREKQREIMEATKRRIGWNASVVEFLTSKVDFNGEFPIEGAKEVQPLMTRYVTRALRTWVAAQTLDGDQADAAKVAQQSAAATLLLKVSEHNSNLYIEADLK